MNWRWRACALLLAVRKQIDADGGHYSKLRRARPVATSSIGASCASWRGRMRSEACIDANGLAIDGGDAGALGDELVDAGQCGATAGEHHLVDLVVRRRREEELQRPGYLQRERLHERLQDVAVIVLRQALVLLRRLGLLGRQVERALDVLGELVAAEGLVAGEQELVVAQYIEVRDVRADVDQGDVLVAPVGRQRRRDQAEHFLRRVRLDVHHARLAGPPTRRWRRGPRPFPCGTRRSGPRPRRDCWARGRGSGSRG